MKTVVVKHELPEWSDWYVDRLRTEFPQHRFHAAHSTDDAMALAAEAQVIMGIAPKMSSDLISSMPRLEWVQSLTTGVDNLLSMAAMPSHVPISKVTGVQGPQMAELALAMMLTLSRRIPEVLDAQDRKIWDRRPQPLLYGKTVCLLGLGSIAETLALYCTTLGMTVTGISGRDSAPNVSRIYPRRMLTQAAAEADFLVVLIPLSDDTRHIVDGTVLGAMKRSAFLINIARGGCVDEAALLNALRKGEIAGAGIDVFETEPLPRSDPLWDAPNAILTAHVGGFADIYHKQCFPTVLNNCRRFFDGGPEALTDAVRRPS